MLLRDDDEGKNVSTSDLHNVTSVLRPSPRSAEISVNRMVTCFSKQNLCEPGASGHPYLSDMDTASILAVVPTN